MTDLEALRRRYGDIRVVDKDLPVDEARWHEWRLWRERHPFAAGAIVWNARGEFLLVRHRPEEGWGDRWATPGGAAEPGEEPEDTVRREVLEEAGIAVEVLRLDLVNLYAWRHPACGVVRMEYLQFEARALGDALRTGPETVEARWFPTLPADVAYREDFEAVVRRGFPGPSKNP